VGEVIVGAVDGLSEVARTFEVIATGLLGLTIGFAYWWTYFDFVGRRRPAEAKSGVLRSQWMLSHLGVMMSIAATGESVGLLHGFPGEADSDQESPYRG